MMSENLKDMLSVCTDIFDEIDDAVYIFDVEGLLRFMNRSAEKIDGLVREKEYGRSFSEIYTIDPKQSPLMRALKTRETVREPRYSYWVGGREVVQSVIVRPLWLGNSFAGVYVVQHDRTDMRSIVEENLSLQQEVFLQSRRRAAASSRLARSLVGESEVFTACRDAALRAAENDSSVMLVGNTGSGKELFARAIHENSHRRERPFLALNCAAIPEDLLEGILFGTSKGVYTGAVEREGLLLQAEGGTVFLDEINSMPLSSQAKLLRVLEERKVYKLGTAKGRAIDVRFISSSNEMPQLAVDRGALREDLFYRLSVIYLRIPSLTERKDDIPLLVNHFIREFNERFRKNVPGVSEEVMEFFMEYPWSGNVRQLRHCIESAMNFSENGQWISFSNLPPYLFDGSRKQDADTVFTAPSQKKIASEEGAKTLMDSIREEEKQALIDALREAKGNMAQAARILGLSRQTVVYRAKKYKLK